MRTPETSPRIVVVDFESQLAGVIAARYGEIGVPTDVIRYDQLSSADLDPSITKGIWLAGGKHDVNQEGAPQVPDEVLKANEEFGTPIMASCYGEQALAVALGGTVCNSAKQELGRTKVRVLGGKFALPSANGEQPEEDMLMSHVQVVKDLPEDAVITAMSPAGIAGYEIIHRKIFAQQGHVESPQTTHGKRFFESYAEVCGITPSAEAAENYIEKVLGKSDKEIVEKAKEGFIQVFLSGGIDSSVCAVRAFNALRVAGLEHRAVFTYVDTGTMRNQDRATIDELIEYGIPVEIVDESELFMNTAVELTPEEARREKLSNPILPSLEDAPDARTVRLISRYAFVRVHQKQAQKIRDEHGPGTKVFLVMGNNAADIAESEADIKQHHNEGIEESTDGVILPLKSFFKGQIRKTGKKEGLSPSLYLRQPFPGPALSIRVVPSIPEFRVGTEPFNEANELLRNYGRIALKDFKFSLTPDRTRAVRGDAGSDGYSVVLESKNGQVPWSEMPDMAREIGNEISVISRVGLAPLGFDEGTPHYSLGLRRNRQTFELLRQLESFKDSWLATQDFEHELTQHFIALTDSSLNSRNPYPTAWLRLFQSGGWGKANEDLMTGIVPFPGVDGFVNYDKALRDLAINMMLSFRIGGFILDATEKPYGTVERI